MIDPGRGCEPGTVDIDMATIPMEYLYVDERRLDAYFEQISSPVKYEKIPTWRVGLQIAGPSVEGVQARPSRPFTTHEKIRAVCDYLVSLGMSEQVPTQYSADSMPFVSKVIDAALLVIPQMENVDTAFHGARIWVSHRATLKPPAAPSEFLILMEDFPRRDDEPGGCHFSIYSSLLLLSEALTFPGKIRLITGDRVYSYDARCAEREFSLDPVAFLAKLGAKKLFLRRISTVFRLRVTGTRRSVFLGYPLFITAVD
jgi:hypothetical protein